MGVCWGAAGPVLTPFPSTASTPQAPPWVVYIPHTADVQSRRDDVHEMNRSLYIIWRKEGGREQLEGNVSRILTYDANRENYSV